MKTSTDSLLFDVLRGGFLATLAIGALAVLSARAQADEVEEIVVNAPSTRVDTAQVDGITVTARPAQADRITIATPTVRRIGRDDATGAPINLVTVEARVTLDPDTLTTKAGVAELKESVLKAARRACTKADPLMLDDGTCVRDAIRTAQPQVTALIAQARNGTTANG